MNILGSRERCKVLLGKRGDFIYDIQQAMWKYKDMNEDAFSLGQLESKHWAVEIMEDLHRVRKIDYGTVFILCGWYGILAAMMFYAHLPILKIRSFDIDPDCFKIADAINKKNIVEICNFRTCDWLTTADGDKNKFEDWIQHGGWTGIFGEDIYKYYS